MSLPTYVARVAAATSIFSVRPPSVAVTASQPRPRRTSPPVLSPKSPLAVPVVHVDTVPVAGPQLHTPRGLPTTPPLAGTPGSSEPRCHRFTSPSSSCQEPMRSFDLRFDDSGVDDLHAKLTWELGRQRQDLAAAIQAERTLRAHEMAQLKAILEQADQRLERDLALSRNVLTEAAVAHAGQRAVGELAEDRAVWLASEVRRLAAVVDAAPWAAAEEALRRELGALRREMEAVVMHLQAVQAGQDSLQKEVVSCKQFGREAAAVWIAIPTLVSRLEAIEKVESQHHAEAEAALQSLAAQATLSPTYPHAELAALEHRCGSSSDAGEGKAGHMLAASCACSTACCSVEGCDVAPTGQVLSIEEGCGASPGRALVSLCPSTGGEIGLPSRSWHLVRSADSDEGLAKNVTTAATAQQLGERLRHTNSDHPSDVAAGVLAEASVIARNCDVHQVPLTEPCEECCSGGSGDWPHSPIGSQDSTASSKVVPRTYGSLLLGRAGSV
mmetsp:Transcript_89367/g.177670  ORF Transcript_89367/g.177670 Transcript_89367/m.177670 type:complete len:499 (-) Transcript_89367:244-1740(-)